MTITRNTCLAAVTVAGVLALTACSSDAASSTSASTSISGVSCATGSLKASGSSAQANAMTEWINSYQTTCTDSTINYQPNGSGSGIQDFINKQTSFAGSDAAISGDDKTKADARCAAGPAINIPAVGGAIVLAYNLAGLDKLILTPEVAAGIFDNSVTKWDDPKIAALNPGVTLPDATIAQFHRSDSSGTTFNFTSYLSAASNGAWTTPGSKDWTASGGQGSKGSDGVTSSVKSTPNSIGYVELSFAQNSSLATAWLDNGGGAVEATSENAAKTISAAKIVGAGNDLALSIDYATKAPGAYPAVLVTYQIACEKGGDAATLPLTKSFLSYIVTADGQAQLTSSGYVPVSGELLTKVRASVASIS